MERTGAYAGKSEVDASYPLRSFGPRPVIERIVLRRTVKAEAERRFVENGDSTRS